MPLEISRRILYHAQNALQGDPHAPLSSFLPSFLPAAFSCRNQPTNILFLLASLFALAFASRFAIALPEGRTLDEGHDSGYIDWNGSVEYTNFWHRDALCPAGCFEMVSLIGSGSSVSGSFRVGVEVDYFEVMVARGSGNGFGTATLTACSSNTSVFLDSGGHTPGFNSVSLYVPPGCDSWSLSASGGDVYFRSVDANYSAPPQPPVITGGISCAQPGNGGWCLGGQNLHLEASDPQGQPVIIYGKISGVDFSCPGGATVCDVPITIEGAGLAEFTVLNPTTGLSDSDSLPYQLDASTPQLDLTLSGASGLGGWFVSAVDVSASASDAVSGLGLLQVSVDGSAFAEYQSPITLPDGTHTITAQAYDAAGNLAELTQMINVDTLTPELQISVNGTAGNNGWYISPVEISASAQDNGSGVAALEISVDGGPYVNYQSPITLTDGIHTVQFRAADNAGNVTTVEQEINVDTLTPGLSLTVNGTAGNNGWYISPVEVSASAQDNGSGIAALEVSVDGSPFAAYRSPIPLSDGLHTYQARVKDMAGNVTQTSLQSVKVDTIAPFIDMPETLSLGERLYYSLQDDGSGLALYRAVIEDEDEKYQKVVWLDTLSGNKVEGDLLWDGKFKDGTKAAPGEYFITLKISDAAGNERMMSTVVSVTLLNSLIPLPALVVEPVETEPPVITLTPTPLPQGEGGGAATFGGETVIPAAQPTPSIVTGGGNRVEKQPVTTQTVSKAPVASPIPASAILWGAASAAAVGFFVAEAQRRKEEEERREREAAEEQQNALAQMFLNDKKPEPEPKTTPRKKKKPLTARERLQAIWDRNGAMIYEINRQFKARFGREMDAATREQAIKDATKNGIFQANQYAENLSAAKRRQAARNQAIAAKIERMEAEEGRRLRQRPTVRPKPVIPPSGTHHFARQPKSAPAQSAKPSLWSKVASGVKNTIKKVVAPVVNVLQPKKNMGGGGHLAAPARQNGNPPPSEEKDCGFLGYKCWKEWIGNLFGKRNPPPATPMPTILPTPRVYITPGGAWIPTPAITPTPSNFLELQVANLAHQRYPSDSPVYQYKYPSSNCSNFVSQILWEAGIRFPGSSWDGDHYKSSPTGNGNETWIRTPEQQQLFSSYNGEFRIVLNGNVPLKDDPVYAQILKDYPQLFTPGKVIFTSNRVITTIDGQKSSDFTYPFSHAMIVDINATPGNPIVVEHSGPADYVVENGAYKAIWEHGDWHYVPNPEPIRQPRLLSDMPTGQIVVEGYSGTMTKDVTISEISIVPVEKIDLGAYGLDKNLVNSSPSPLPPYDEQKPCFSIQPALYYCPPTVPTP